MQDFVGKTFRKQITWDTKAQTEENIKMNLKEIG
jgi:hypothetical protein